SFSIVLRLMRPSGVSLLSFSALHYAFLSAMIRLRSACSASVIGPVGRSLFGSLSPYSVGSTNTVAPTSPPRPHSWLSSEGRERVETTPTNGSPMKYIRLGSSGLKISRIVLGCMSYGEPGRGSHGWSLPEDESRPFFREAIEAGISTFDTANVYSLGSSEEITGKLLREFTTRDQVIIATKLAQPMGSGPNDRGLSRGAIMTQIDASLRRLGTDYVDLYQVHRFDPH